MIIFLVDVLNKIQYQHNYFSYLKNGSKEIYNNRQHLTVTDTGVPCWSNSSLPVLALD